MSQIEIELEEELILKVGMCRMHSLDFLNMSSHPYTAKHFLVLANHTVHGNIAGGDADPATGAGGHTLPLSLIRPLGRGYL